MAVKVFVKRSGQTATRELVKDANLALEDAISDVFGYTAGIWLKNCGLDKNARPVTSKTKVGDLAANTEYWIKCKFVKGHHCIIVA